jgi:LuxR family transcriptional regulator, maltose regulon positive regulatory protein
MLSNAGSKTAVPALPVSFLPRPVLLAELDDDRTTLICAPRGYGKTTLLAHWARAGTVPADRIAWVDLHRGCDIDGDVDGDIDGNEPAGLWSAVLTAVRACAAVPVGSALRELAPGTAPGPEFVAELVSAFDALPVPITLVLHDLHEVVDGAALRSLETFVAAGPAGARIVMCSRLDPPLALGALRAADDLREIRLDRLRFSAAETAAVLRDLNERGGGQITAQQSRRVHAATRGRPAHVRLAGTALRAAPDRDAFLDRLETDEHALADFLVGEVLATLTAGERRVLAAAAVCGPLPARSAAGFADPGGQPILDRLLNDSGLLTDDDTADRYLVHPLVGAHLRAESRRMPAETRELRRAAARWCAAEGDAVAAIGHAAAAGDEELLVGLVHRFAATLLVHGDHRTLRRALSRLTGPMITDDPWLTLCSALTHLEDGDPVLTAAEVEHALGIGQANPDPRLCVLRSTAAVFAAVASVDFRAAPETVGRALIAPLLPEWRALALAGIGGSGIFARTDRDTASAALDEAIALARTHGYAHLEMQCLTLLAGVRGMAGDYPAMSATADAALAAAAAGGQEGTLWAVADRLMLACVALMRAEPAAARRHAGDALHIGKPSAMPPQLLYMVRAVHGAALIDTGERHRGLQQMQQARAELGTTTLSAELAALPAVIEHRAAVALGRTEDAGEIIRWLTGRIGPLGEVLVMQAWAEMSAGRDHAARSTVGPLLDGSVSTVLPHTVVDALLVEASADVTNGDVHTAADALRSALAAGAPLDAVRQFATAEPPARLLLDHHLGRTPDPASTAEFAARALAAGRGVDHRRTARLDEAELGVLAHLRSPLSVQQIAGTLGLPVTETHARIRVVYRKLGVSSRRTAVAAAHERGLLG